MQLEQMFDSYQQIQMQRTPERERVYTIVDLESLSASALYTGEYVFNNNGSLAGINGFDVNIPSKIDNLRVGMTLPGNLIVKDITSNSVVLNQDHGLLRDLYTLHPDGHGSKREIALTKLSKLIDKKSW